MTAREIRLVLRRSAVMGEVYHPRGAVRLIQHDGAAKSQFHLMEDTLAWRQRLLWETGARSEAEADSRGPGLRGRPARPALHAVFSGANGGPPAAARGAAAATATLSSTGWRMLAGAGTSFTPTSPPSPLRQACSPRSAHRRHRPLPSVRAEVRPDPLCVTQPRATRQPFLAAARTKTGR